MENKLFPQFAFPSVALTSSYATGSAVAVNVPGRQKTGGLPQQFINFGAYWKEATFESIILQLSNIDSAATSVAVRVCQDADLDIAVLPEASAAIVKGVTNDGNGSVVFTGDSFAAGFPFLGTDNLFLAAKVNSGSADLNTAIITWRHEV